MKIAVLGGSFNPPHLGHLLVARQVIKHYGYDEVWLMPCFRQAEGKALAPASQRLEMVELMLSSENRDPRIKASDFEVRSRKKNYTADTVLALQKRFPRHEFSWVFGSELVRAFPNWGKWHVLRNLLPLVIYPRPGFRKPSKKFVAGLGASSLTFLPFNLPKSRVSSTSVRTMLLKGGGRAKRFLAPAVSSYIVSHGLYGSRKGGKLEKRKKAGGGLQ